MVNIPKLKGVHYAMHAGMFAAEAIYEKLSQGGDCTRPLELPGEGRGLATSRRTSTAHATCARCSRRASSSAARSGVPDGVTRRPLPGRPLGRRTTTRTVDVFIGKRWKKYPKPDGKYTFDKLSSVFATGNQSRDDAPSHIRIKKKVPLELGLMWQQMCPAQVYEVPEEILEKLKNGDGADVDPKQEIEIEIAPSNCVQCGAITAKGGRLTPPEGGEGPNYQQT